MMRLLAAGLEPRANVSSPAMPRGVIPQSGRSALPPRKCRGQHVVGEIPDCILAPQLLNHPID